MHAHKLDIKKTVHLNDLTPPIKATVLAVGRLSRHSYQHNIALFSRGSHWEFAELADTHSPHPCNIHNLCQPPLREINAAVCSKLCLIIALWEVGRISLVQPRYLSNIQVTMTTAQSKTTPLNCGCLRRSNLWTEERKWSDAVVSPMKYKSICHFYNEEIVGDTCNICLCTFYDIL